MINKIKDKFLNKQFLAFGLIGAFNTIGALVIYMICVTLNMSEGISSFIGDSITVIFSYFLNMKYTYKTKPTFASFCAFPISYLPGIVINLIMTVIFVQYLNVPKLFAKAFTLPITIPLNFIVVSLVVKLTTKGK